MEIEKRPIHQLKGIYKQDGTASIIENLCLSFEFGSHLIDLCQISPHNLAGVVKQYLAQVINLKKKFHANFSNSQIPNILSS